LALAGELALAVLGPGLAPELVLGLAPA